MLERDLEKYFAKKIKELKGLPIKLSSPGSRGIPDRLVVLPSRVIFVELKTETGKLSKLQELFIEKLKSFGMEIEVLYGKEQIDDFIEGLIL